MRINFPSNFICPVCGIKNDCCIYSFTGHVISKDEMKLGENPTDIPALIMCPNLHICDFSGKLIKPNDKK